MSRVVSVKVTVKILGIRSCFDTGSTLTGTATTEYVPLGAYVVGINRRCYGQNRQLSSDTTAPMVPTSTSKIKPKEMHKKYYEGASSTTMGIPRSISEYWVYLKNEATKPSGKSNYITMTDGSLRADTILNRFMINSAVGQQLISYSYNPKYGLINTTKSLDVPYYFSENGISATSAWLGYDILKFHSCSATESTFNLPPLKTQALETYGLDRITKNGITASLIPRQNSYSTLHSYGYEQKLERDCVWNPVTGAKQMIAQPQLHLGMFAVPAINSALTSESYTNACIYYSVEASLTAQCDFDSMYAKGDMEYWPAEPDFYNGSKMYTTGTCMFGMDFTASGDVSEVEGTRKQPIFQDISTPDTLSALNFSDSDLCNNCRNK